MANDRVKYERQLQANNLLSDTLREERRQARGNEAGFVKEIRRLTAENQELLTKIIVMESALKEEVEALVDV